MKYNNIAEGRFISRPNRFIANVEIGGEIVVCHVKNTGRCRELLLPGARVFLEESGNPNRKTRFDLISVYKGRELVNIDSQAPNKIFAEFVNESGVFGNITKIKPETAYKNSRFDFYIENDSERIFAEVKGVTLEENGTALFPDAPTMRGVKHLRELIDARRNGYRCAVVLIIQMKGVKCFSPNRRMHPEFAEALSEAKENGVEIYAFDCMVSEDEITADKPIDIEL